LAGAATAVALNVTGLPTKPEDVAVMVYVPDLLPSVRKVESCPLAFVVPFVTLNVCPVAPGGVVARANVTAVPETGLPAESVTVTIKGLARAALIPPDCPLPEVRLIVLAGAAVAVAVNVTGLPTRPAEVAVTVYVPVLLPRVRTEVSCPLVFVIPFVVLRVCPVAPPGVDVTANVTDAPLTGFPVESVTVTTKGLTRGALIPPDCPLPEVMVMILAGAASAVA
jgi:hypothetical protein